MTIQSVLCGECKVDTMKPFFSLPTFSPSLPLKKTTVIVKQLPVGPPHPTLITFSHPILQFFPSFHTPSLSYLYTPCSSLLPFLSASPPSSHFLTQTILFSHTSGTRVRAFGKVCVFLTVKLSHIYHRDICIIIKSQSRYRGLSGMCELPVMALTE